MIIQIYEIRSPYEASRLISMGVNHIGTVLTVEADAELPELQETIKVVRRQGAKLSLIPLFDDTGAVIQALTICRPDIVHFCEHIDCSDHHGSLSTAVSLQQQIKRHFPDIALMRTIPISQPHAANPIDSLKLAADIESVSDYFLIDTCLGGDNAAEDTVQPVAGFIGITGAVCDWNIAAKLVTASRIPVILAGGISPSNVFDGIMQVRPAGIDSCTQTNAVDPNGKSIRFQKDLAKVKQLIQEVRRAQEIITKR